MFLAKLVLAVILTELLTELLVKSVIFRPIREILGQVSNFFKELLSCGYCTSVWVAASVVFILQLTYNLSGWYWIDLGLVVLVVHRLSNYLHNFNDKYLDKYYDVRFINSEHPGSEE